MNIYISNSTFVYYALCMEKWNFTLRICICVALITTTACANSSTVNAERQTLAADIYAQLALGYMASGHLELAKQRLVTAQEMGPQRPLTLEAGVQWQKLHPPQQDTVTD